MDLRNTYYRTERYLKRNAPTILTWISVVGVVGTAVLTAKATPKAIDILNEREKEIMTLRYGLNNTLEYTQKEVAEMLGISQSYISRIEKKVVKKLRGVMKI